jgi:hypothetical protein
VNTVNLDSLGFQQFELDDLEALFTTEEVWKVIRDMPSDRAPGRDGFIGLFYQKAWGVIRRQILYSNQGGVNPAPHTACNDLGRPISPHVLFFLFLA